RDRVCKHARIATATAVLGVGEEVRLAPVDGRGVAVAERVVAGADAALADAAAWLPVDHVRAGRAALAAVLDVVVEVDLASGLHRAIAIVEAGVARRDRAAPRRAAGHRVGVGPALVAAHAAVLLVGADVDLPAVLRL